MQARQDPTGGRGGSGGPEGSEPGGSEPETRPPGALREVAAVFLRLGTTAFGGPAAHIAMMRQEMVQRRRWIDDERFLDLLGATNLIPGPNSTEMAIHLGYVRAGWPGLVVAGVLFIGPAMLIVLGFAWAYVAYGTLPAAQSLLYGIKPVIIAVVVQALYGLLRTALKGPVLAAVAAGVVGLYFLGVNELGLLFGGGAVVWLVHLLTARRPPGGPPGGTRGTAGVARGGLFPFGAGVQQVSRTARAVGVAAAAGAVPYSLGTLFLAFLKIGAVLYGSGYVLLAFLQGEFVQRLGWLTERQLLDAVAVGQFTPGPVFTTATFVGYLVGGLPGALVATLGIFLPSFVFVALSGPLVPHLRRWRWTGVLLDGVNAAALGLMAAVTFQLARAAIVDLPTALFAAGALVLLLRFRVNSAWLVLGGGLGGLLVRFLAG